MAAGTAGAMAREPRSGSPANRPDPGHPACLMATLHGPEMINIQADYRVF